MSESELPPSLQSEPDTGTARELAHGSLTAFKIDCLRPIEEQTRSGQEIKDRLKGLEGYGPINHGRLYPNLDALVYNGLVEKSNRDRRTNEYEVTEKGERMLSIRRQWLLSGGGPDE